MSIFEGSAVALVTPFTQNGINFEELGKLLDFHLQNSTDAILACGTTGEPSTMTKEEKKQVIKFCVDHVAGRIPVLAGTGGNNTAEVVEFSRFAQQAGADALLIVTPYYNKCSQAGLIRHYYAVGDAVDIPVIVYNVPSRTGVNVLPATYAALARHENIRGIKEASGNISQIVKTASLVKDKMDIYSGNDDQIVPILSVGGKGVISVLANILPKETHDLCAAYLSGNVAKACELQLRYTSLVEALFSDVNPIPVKTALNLMGYQAGPLRLPLCEMSREAEAKLKATLAEYGLV